MAVDERRSVFQLEGVAEPGMDVFGLWTETQATGAEHIEYGLTPPQSVSPVWRVNWTGDAAADVAALAEAEAVLSRSLHALDSAAPRLHDLLYQSRQSSRPPEAMLGALLHGPGGNDVVVSYGLLDASAAWLRIVEEFERGLGVAERMLAYPAWIETATSGRLLGRTITTWGGEQASLWLTDVTNEQMRGHRRALDLAIRTRAAFLRMVAVAIRASTLLTAASTPLGPLLALPATWEFVQEVVREIRWVREPR